MNKIFFCQTPFQIIVAMLIKEQFSKSEDCVDIVIVNAFSDYRNVAERLEECDMFNKVHIAEVYDTILARGIKDNFKKALKVLFSKAFISVSLPECKKKYDEMYCWNYDVFTALFRSVNSMANNVIKTYIFEEGYISYFPIEKTIPKRGFMKCIEFKNRILGKKNLKREDIDGYFFFDPRAVIFETNAPIYTIDRSFIHTEKINKTINYIFNVKSEIAKYNCKYIIFEEAMLANHKEIDDVGLFLQIANVVGKDNVLIKLHPRTKEGNRFDKNGIKTIESNGVPWEAIAMCGDFKDKILISISSGAVTSYRMLMGDNIKAFMLFKFIKPDSSVFDNRYSHFWNSIESNEYGKGILMPKTKEEFETILVNTRRLV